MKNNKSKFSLYILFVVIGLSIYFISSKEVSAEAGLSEAGRTEYYFLNERLGISVLPGGEGGEGDDYISLFEYKRSTTLRSENFVIQGIDGERYEYLNSELNLDINKNTYLTGNYLWNGNWIFDIENFQKLYNEDYYTCYGESDWIESYPLDSKECQEYKDILDELHLEDSAKKMKFDYDYIQNNCEYMGYDSFMSDISTFYVIIFSIICGCLCFALVLGVILITVIYKAIKKSNYQT